MTATPASHRQTPPGRAKAAVDAFLRDLGQIGLLAQCIAFTVDGFRYPDRVEREACTFFDIMRRYFIERASTHGYEAIDLDPLFLARYQETAERFVSPMTFTGMQMDIV